MWVTPEVNLPEQVISAQRDGRLVIFAGAGISMGPPSNLPSFAGLADGIASGAYVREEREPLDRFVGRLEQEGIDVQSLARRIIGDPTSAPKQIHHDLVNLFGTADRVRIVTTNFDNHLTTAARQRFGEAVQLHYAPAVPRGRDLSGIVYIHGSVERPNPLLLTDRDLGQAYIVDWWATRMLTEMFHNYCVLFVGYSHQDVVMQYLARSLIAPERFAFTEPGQDRYWQYLGITPVHFPLRTAPDRFGALEEALRAWIALAQMGVLDHERRIQEIVAAPPPLERDRADYIASVLRDPVQARYFANHARGLDWLRWADEIGAFAPLFRPEKPSTEVAPVVAEWFAESYATNEHLAALELVRKHGSGLNSILWVALARHLAVCSERPEPHVLFAWVAVLTQSMNSGWTPDFLSDILQACRSEDVDAALHLFRRLTRPTLRFEREWPFEGERTKRLGVRVEIDIPAERYVLDQVWSRLFVPSLPDVHSDLLILLGSHLTEAHALLRGAGRASRDWDPLSFMRSAVEAHAQDRYPDDRDFLVDAARDTLDWCALNASDTAAQTVGLWGNADSPLLRRLSIHALGTTGILSADAVLLEIEKRDWLYSIPLKHEVFQLIRSAFSSARADSRSRFIRYSMEATSREGRQPTSAPPISDYERFNVAVWLAKVAPECQMAAAHLAALRPEHPDFDPRPFPDLDHWSGDFGWVAHRSPTTPDELRKGALEAKLDELLSFAPPEDFERGAPDRIGLLNDIREATKESPAWGLQLLAALATRGEWASDLWPSVFSGWQDADSNKDWDEFLDLVLAHEEAVEQFESDLADVLERATQDEGQRFSSVQLTKIVEIGERLLARARTSSPSDEDDSDVEWLGRAINNTGGKVALIWLRALARGQGEESRHLPTAFAARFSSLIEGASAADLFGRVILASQLHLLYGIDREWTARLLLPLFDWDHDVRGAEQAWHGYLGWGQWNDALFSALTPNLTKSFAHLNGELSRVRGTFAERLAAVAAFSLKLPWPGWLMDFARDAPSEDRGLWADHFARYLGQMPGDAARKRWDSWIRSYWEARNTGVPRQLSDDERTALIESAIRQPAIFQEAVTLAVASPAPAKPSRTLFFQLREAHLAKLYPEPVARLVRHLLSAASSLLYDCGYVEPIVREAAAAGAEKSELRAICEQMARLGCMNAIALQQDLEKGP